MLGLKSAIETNTKKEPVQKREAKTIQKERKKRFEEDNSNDSDKAEEDKAPSHAYSKNAFASHKSNNNDKFEKEDDTQEALKNYSLIKKTSPLSPDAEVKPKEDAGLSSKTRKEEGKS